MKTLALSILFLSTYHLMSQGSIMENDLDWNKWEKNISEATRQQHLNNLFENTEKVPRFVKQEFIKGSNLSSFHLIDANDDSLIDLVYNGPVGTGDGIIVFLNVGSSYAVTNTISGKIIGLEKSALSGLLAFKVLRNSSDEHYRSVVHLSVKPNDIKLIITAEYSYKTNTQLPVSYFTPKTFVVKREHYNLRAQPIFDRASNIWAENIEGNVVAIYPVNSIGKAIGQTTDEKGRLWWFVIMENNIQPTKSLLVYRKPTNMSMGWMSARFLEEIKP